MTVSHEIKSPPDFISWETVFYSIFYCKLETTEKLVRVNNKTNWEMIRFLKTNHAFNDQDIIEHRTSK